MSYLNYVRSFIDISQIVVYAQMAMEYYKTDKFVGII